MTFSRDGLWDFFRITLLWLHSLPSVVYAKDAATAFPLTTSSWAGGPRSHLPYGAWQISTRPDVWRLQVVVALAGEEACTVSAFNAPPGPSGAAALGALRPFSHHPVRHPKWMDHMQRRQWALPLFGLVKGHISGDEKGIFDLGKVIFSCGCQELNSDGLLQLPKALDPLQRRGGATVL